MVNLRQSSIPETEAERYRQGEAKAEKRLKDRGHSEPDGFHWPYRPRMADELELGDWIIQVITDKDKVVTVYPPGQLLFIDHYIRNSDSARQRYVFHLEVPKRGETMSWTEFRRTAKSLLKSGKLVAPRTAPIREAQVADRFLALWTPGGRLSRR